MRSLTAAVLLLTTLVALSTAQSSSISSAIEVSLNGSSYTVNEGDGQLQVSVSLSITGKFFFPVYASIELCSGTATDPEDYSSEGRYNVTFRPTNFTDGDDPVPSTLSLTVLINITNDNILEGVEFIQACITVTADNFSVVIGPQDTVNVTIIDDDNVTVRYEEERYRVEEEAGYVTLSLVLEGDAAIPVTVSVNTLDLQNSSVGDAATDDYIPRTPFEITFPPGNRRQLYNVTVVDDAIPENSEFFNADINVARPEDASRIRTGSPKQPLIEIQDLVDQNVEIFFDQTAYSIFENAGMVTVTVKLSDTYNEDIVVNVAVGELKGIQEFFKAQAGVDFSTAGFSQDVTIPAGQTSVQFKVTVINELIVERVEQFQISFTYSGGQPGVIVRPGFDQANITIKNDDVLTVGFKTKLYHVLEDNGNLSYQLIASGKASFPYEVVVTAVNGSARCGLAYHETIEAISGTNVASCSYSFTVTIPAGGNGGIGIVAIINDTVYEGQEEFYLDLSVAPEFQTLRILEAQSSLRATVQIEDDDELRVFFDSAFYSVLEGENQTLVLLADEQFKIPFTIGVTLMDITAVAPGDYENRSYQVEFQVDSQRGTLVVSAELDYILEKDEQLKAMLSVPAGIQRVSEGTPSEAIVTIRDQTAAEVYINSTTYSVLEGQPANVTLKLTRTIAPTVTIVVFLLTWDVSAIDGTDYTGGFMTATFSGSSTAIVQVPTLSDDVLEGVERFSVIVLVPADTTENYRVRRGSPDSATVEINDEDNLKVFFSSASYSLLEGQSQVLVLEADKQFEVPFTINVTLMDITAVAPGDYESRSYRVEFNVTTQSGTLVVQTVEDNILEKDEQLKAVLSVPSSSPRVSERTPAEAIVTIRDQTSAEVHFDSSTYSVPEGQPANLTLKLTGDVDFNVTIIVRVQTMDGSAMDGPDYTGGLLTVIFNGSNTAVVQVPTLSDEVAERMENFTAVIEVSTNTTRDYRVMHGLPDTATVQIDDDDKLNVFFEPVSYNVTEGGTITMSVMVSSTNYSFSFSVSLNYKDNSSVDRVDYLPMVFNVDFSAAQERATFEVPTIDDNIAELTETFTIVIVNTTVPDQVMTGEPHTASVNLIDNDVLIVVFGSADYQVPEGEAEQLMLTTNRPHSFSFTVNVTTQNRSAESPVDFTGGGFIASFSASPASEGSSSVEVSIKRDNILEGFEYFSAVLSVPEEFPNVEEGSVSVVSVNITDTTIAGVYFDPDVYMVDEGSNVTVVLMTNVTVNREFGVLVNTDDDSAHRGADYIGEEFPVLFSPGNTEATFNITIVNDNAYEPDEYFFLTLEIPQAAQDIGVMMGDPFVANVIIKDDEIIMPVPGGCPTEEDSEWRIQWFAIAAGFIQSARCPGEGNTTSFGLAYRRCLYGMHGRGEWGPVDASECESVAAREARIKIDNFINSLEKSNDTDSVLTDSQRRLVRNISQDLNAALTPSDKGAKPIPPRDLKTAVKFVEVVADLGESNGLFDGESNDTQKAVADILSNVLDERNEPAFAATSQNTEPEANRTATPAVSILQSTERVAKLIATTLSKNKTSFTISRPNIAMNGQQHSSTSLPSAVVFPGADVTVAVFRNQEVLPQIHLPRSFLLAARGIEVPSENATVEVVNVVMNNMENYLPSDVNKEEEEIEDEEDPEQIFLASLVISSQISGYNGSDVNTKEKVEVIFHINEKSQNLPVPPGKVKQFRCAFFIYPAEEANQTGGWSYRGVETEVINSTHVCCNASHLTSFVVLVSIVSAGEPPALDYITYIGCSISLVCLIASIIFFISLRKELIQKLHNFVHLNLCIALSLGLFFFLTGIQTATGNSHACKFMTALLHYFFLATFTWTMCEAVLIYILLVKVFGANDRKWIYLYLALGWALPIPIVVITGGARHDYYLIRASFDQSHPHYDSIKACWLPSEKGVIFAFVGPMVAIIVVNAVLLTISLVSLARSQCGRMSEMTSKIDERRQKYMEVGKQLLKATIILVPLMGFTWIIGLFAVGEEGRVFAYLFVFANVFQGLFIFVLHVVRHEKVYAKIKSKLPDIMKRVTVITRTGSGSATEGARSSKSDVIDNRKGSSFALEPEAIIEFGGKHEDEDAVSIKEEKDMDIKLNAIEENTEDEKNNDCEESLAVATAAFEMSAATKGTLEEEEEEEEEEMVKGDSTDSHAGKEGNEESELTCAAATSGAQSDNDAGSVMDTAC